ncbi:hypothetical protein FOMPIDRAFT_32703, partial [Fomitopsis schrenkii]
FPSIFRMAKDYIPTQAISVQCARAFPSISKMDAPLGSSVSRDMFEAKQVLRY